MTPGRSLEDRPRAGRLGLLSLAIALCLSFAPGGVPAAGDVSAAADDGRPFWIWPLAGFRLEQGYVAPLHAYGPGHRGIDLRPLVEPEVRAPDDGVVAFAGDVAGRGILTIEHSGGLVSTLEPIATQLRAGDVVARGETVGVVDRGGHAADGAVHLGVRRDGEYVNPLLLLGGVPRAVLLPCC